MINKIFKCDGKGIRKEHVRPHWFNALLAAFPEKLWSFSSPSKSEISAFDLSMFATDKHTVTKFDVLDCTLKTKAYAFAPSMHSERSLAGSIGVFNDLEVEQMDIEQSNPQWKERLTIWWGDLKTWILMRSIQTQGEEEQSNRPYHQYKHIFPGLARW